MALPGWVNYRDEIPVRVSSPSVVAYKIITVHNHIEPKLWKVEHSLSFTMDDALWLKCGSEHIFYLLTVTLRQSTVHTVGQWIMYADLRINRHRGADSS